MLIPRYVRVTERVSIIRHFRAHRIDQRNKLRKRQDASNSEKN